MIDITGLRKEFRSGDHTVAAVDDVSIQIPSGAFAAVVGPSGSGKSTLLALVGALDRPTSGTIVVDGTDITALPARKLVSYRREEIGFVFQNYGLIANLTALENVMLPMEFAGVSAVARRERATALLTEVGLTAAKQDRKPGRLSGGEQQRVALARALANAPRLVLADEPTGNLDSKTGRRIIRLLQEMARDQSVTVVTVTHDRSIAARADVTFPFNDGRLVTGAPVD